jgi:hypothetical protein
VTPSLQKQEQPRALTPQSCGTATAVIRKGWPAEVHRQPAAENCGVIGSQAGKVAIVTGGTANLGLLFAAALASDGADVVLHYNSAGRSDEAKQAAPPTWKSTAC